MKVRILPGIVKDVTIFNDEIIRGLNAMPVKDRLEVLFGIDLDKNTTQKQLMVAIIDNLLNSYLSINDNLAISSFLTSIIRELRKKLK